MDILEMKELTDEQREVVADLLGLQGDHSYFLFVIGSSERTSIAAQSMLKHADRAFTLVTRSGSEKTTLQCIKSRY